MQRYQKWLSVGLLALTPGIAMAGPFSLSRKEKTPEAPVASVKKPKGSNQEMAYKVRDALKGANLKGCQVDVTYMNGVAVLEGTVNTPEQKLAASKAANSVKGVRVENRLAISEPAPRGGVQQAAARETKGTRGRIRQAQGFEGQEPSQIPAGEGLIQPEPMPPGLGGGPMGPMPPGGPMGPGGAMGPGGPMPATYGPPTAGSSHAVYNQPNFPNYAWPSYAQYPNYAAVSYPTQYSASAWPYIGPFYPYPQVPLGWRKATLEWDDGYWQLSFAPRTDRWWWFLDPKNW